MKKYISLRFQDASAVRPLLSSYLFRFSTLAGPVITCGPVLNWFELDNRGRRLVAVAGTGAGGDCLDGGGCLNGGTINTPAVAAAYAVRRYTKQAQDELSFEVRQHN